MKVRFQKNYRNEVEQFKRTLEWGHHEEITGRARETKGHYPFQII